MTNQCDQLSVVGVPEFDNFTPRPLVVTLHPNPFIAIVSRQVNPDGKLKADETLVVVGRGIHQMSEYLFRRPFPRSRPHSRLLVPDLLQAIDSLQRGQQIISDG